MDDEHTIRVHWNTDKRTLFFYQNYLERKLLLPNLSHFCHFDTQTDQNLQRVCVCSVQDNCFDLWEEEEPKKNKTGWTDSSTSALVSLHLPLFAVKTTADVGGDWNTLGGGEEGWRAGSCNHQLLCFWGCLQITSRDLKLTSLWQQSCELVSVVLFYLHPYDLIPVSN